MDRKTYIREIYHKYWLTARDKKYGFPEYDKELCNLVTILLGKISKEKLLMEVAIGTGYPFAHYFVEKGFSVYGIDISKELIEECRKLYPDIKCKVGDAEELDYHDNYFNLVYCFHSTWLFINLNKAIEEMLRVAKPGGYVTFDIMNRNNEQIRITYNKRIKENTGSGKILKYLRNLVKVFLHKGTTDWHFVVYEVPTFPEDIYNQLRKHSKVRSFSVFARNRDGFLLEQKEFSSLENWDRIVFAINTK